MSGQKINDHSFWAGGRSKESIFPEGVKSKSYADTEGAGHVGTEYPDTSERVHAEQESGVRKVHAYANKPDKRN